jgi:hypothetical protein
MNRPIILSFGFEARSGKGECCQTIYKRHSIEHGGKFNILRISFAQRLRDEIHDAMWTRRFPYDRNDPKQQQAAMASLCHWAGIEYDPNPLFDDLNPFGKQRRLQQWWGTEYRRQQNPRYWLDYVDERIHIAKPDVVAIDDMRFGNEAEWTETNNGITVKTTRIGLKPIQNGIPGHISESQLANYPFMYQITAREGQLQWLRSQALNLFDFVTR